MKTSRRSASVAGRRGWDDHDSVCWPASAASESSAIHRQPLVVRLNDRNGIHGAHVSTLRPSANQLWRHWRHTRACNSVLTQPTSIASDPHSGQRGAGFGSPLRRPARDSRATVSRSSSFGHRRLSESSVYAGRSSWNFRENPDVRTCGVWSGPDDCEPGLEHREFEAHFARRGRVNARDRDPLGASFDFRSYNVIVGEPLRTAQYHRVADNWARDRRPTRCGV